MAFLLVSWIEHFPSFLCGEEEGDAQLFEDWYV